MAVCYVVRWREARVAWASVASAKAERLVMMSAMKSDRATSYPVPFNKARKSILLNHLYSLTYCKSRT